MNVGMVHLIVLILTVYGANAVPAGGYYNKQFQTNKNKDILSLLDPYFQDADDYNFDKRIENFLPGALVGNANVKLFRDPDFMTKMFPKYINFGDQIMDTIQKLKQRVAKNYKRYSADSLGLQTLGKRVQDSLSFQTFGKRLQDVPQQVQSSNFKK